MWSLCSVCGKVSAGASVSTHATAEPVKLRQGFSSYGMESLPLPD